MTQHERRKLPRGGAAAGGHQPGGDLESTTDEGVLEKAGAEVRRWCGERPPTIVDPFVGGGFIPLEAQRLGLDTQASDLKPRGSAHHAGPDRDPATLGGSAASRDRSR